MWEQRVRSHSMEILCNILDYFRSEWLLIIFPDKRRRLSVDDECDGRVKKTERDTRRFVTRGLRKLDDGNRGSESGKERPNVFSPLFVTTPFSFFPSSVFVLCVLVASAVTVRRIGEKWAGTPENVFLTKHTSYYNTYLNKKTTATAASRCERSWNVDKHADQPRYLKSRPFILQQHW